MKLSEQAVKKVGHCIDVLEEVKLLFKDIPEMKDRVDESINELLELETDIKLKEKEINV